MDDCFDVLEHMNGCVISQRLRLTALHFARSTGERLLRDLRQNQRANPSSSRNYPDRRAAFCPRNSIESIFQFFSSVDRHSADG
jgi:hypothetical protein